MATTIQVEDKTLSLLKHLKARHGMKTYDAVIRLLAAKKTKPVSYLGAHPGMPRFTAEDRMKFHDEE